jgi:hypothetical protein
MLVAMGRCPPGSQFHHAFFTNILCDYSLFVLSSLEQANLPDFCKKGGIIKNEGSKTSSEVYVVLWSGCYSDNDDHQCLYYAVDSEGIH